MEVVRTERFGIFTIVEIKNENGKRAIGISRRSHLDSKKDTLGVVIATGRAKKALLLKEKKKKVNNIYMG